MSAPIAPSGVEFILAPAFRRTRGTTPHQVRGRPSPAPLLLHRPLGFGGRGRLFRPPAAGIAVGALLADV